MLDNIEINFMAMSDYILSNKPVDYIYLLHFSNYFVEKFEIQKDSVFDDLYDEKFYASISIEYKKMMKNLKVVYNSNNSNKKDWYQMLASYDLYADEIKSIIFIHMLILEHLETYGIKNYANCMKHLRNLNHEFFKIPELKLLLPVFIKTNIYDVDTTQDCNFYLIMFHIHQILARINMSVSEMQEITKKINETLQIKSKQNSTPKKFNCIPNFGWLVLKYQNE